MATVLLRMAGLDSLNGNAEPQPPNGESAQVEQTIGRGERHTVVGTNGLGQAAFLKQALKSGKSSLFFDRLHSLAEQKVAAGVIGNDPVTREMPNSRHNEAMLAPSFSRNTNRMRSSTIDRSFYGLHTSVLD